MFIFDLNIWTSMSWQNVSLQGYPESSKSVVLITGTAEYNMVSLDSTLSHAFGRWERLFFVARHDMASF